MGYSNLILYVALILFYKKQNCSNGFYAAAAAAVKLFASVFELVSLYLFNWENFA